MSVDAAFVNIDGPWEHRYVSANGARFHVAEIGDGPLVVMLHGFPQFWYAWRHQMVALAHAGYRVAAMDLRGFGGSDKPPRGYDTYMAHARRGERHPRPRREGRRRHGPRPGWLDLLVHADAAART